VRVIAGTAGGLQLKVPRTGVRPTMDRVKAAIFSSLGEKVIGARILDLFAGAGGLGIEAMSRGAASAVFVESNRNAARTIERNLATASVDGRVRVRDAFDYLKYATGPFDIIFADPPYEKTRSGENFTEKLLANKELGRLLNFAGIFVLEKRPGETLPEIKLWRVTRQKTYGATEVLFLCQSDAKTRRTPKALRAELKKK